VSAYTKLEDHFREIANFHHAIEILGWDNPVMMPSGRRCPGPGNGFPEPSYPQTFNRPAYSRLDSRS